MTLKIKQLNATVLPEKQPKKKFELVQQTKRLQYMK